MALAGLSSLGVKFGYGVETVAGTKPTAFKQVTRVNALGGINIEPEQIDASALEDYITKYIEGRADTGGSFPVTINLTPDTITEWTALIKAYKDLKNGLQMWFETIFPNLDKGFFVIAQPPSIIPQPEVGQNDLVTVEMNLTIVEYKGLDDKVEFTLGE